MRAFREDGAAAKALEEMLRDLKVPDTKARTAAQRLVGFARKELAGEPADLVVESNRVAEKVYGPSRGGP